jgi:hypothetical protein
MGIDVPPARPTPMAQPRLLSSHLIHRSGQGWIRTSEGVKPADLQSAPFGHSGTYPFASVDIGLRLTCRKSALRRGNLHSAFGRAPLHALLVNTGLQAGAGTLRSRRKPFSMAFRKGLQNEPLKRAVARITGMKAGVNKNQAIVGAALHLSSSAVKLRDLFYHKSLRFTTQFWINRQSQCFGGRAFCYRKVALFMF